MSGAQKTKLTRLQFVIFDQRFGSCRLGVFFRARFVKILARYAYRACGFSSPARKTPAIKLLPFEQEAL
jgi:hypothetical protein